MNFLSVIFHTTRFWGLIVVLSFLLGIMSVVAGRFDSSGRVSHRVASLWARLLCRWSGVRVDIQGLEHILKDRPQIFVANHQSYFDIFALAGYLPVQIRWVAKASLFRIPFLGWSMRAAGYIPVERENRKQAYQSFLATIEKLNAGCSVVIFPEGTRSEDGTLGPFKKGGPLLAARSKAPMLPVTIIGSGRIIKKKGVLIRPGPIRIIISAPVFVHENDPQHGDRILETIRETIRTNYESHSAAPAEKAAKA